MFIVVQLLVAPLKFCDKSVLGAQVKLELELRLNDAPGQTDIGFALAVTLGIGSTVTVMVKTGLTHPPSAEVATTLYSTVPEVALLGLVSVWLMLAPEPAVAPVIPPVMVPMVQVNEAVVLAVRVMPVDEPEQILKVGALVTTGPGLTVTVIVTGLPKQVPEVERGVTMYSTDPGSELLGLVSVWLILDPLPGVAPVIPPVILSIVHWNEEGMVDVSVIPVLPPLQIS